MECPCCGPSDPAPGTDPALINMDARTILEAGTHLSFSDILGGWKVRWGIKRMDYKVSPGLYKIGDPDDKAPVLVTANYKLTFDGVRKELAGLDVWLLVLDTKGVNVWCAAGKGTFGTEELICRIKSTGLDRVVNHGTIILPQLGAPGVAAHVVKKETGFRVVYGPIYAKDIRQFLNNGMKAQPEMRKVRFGIMQRMSVVPMEIVPALKYLLAILLAVILLRLLDGTGVNSGIITDFIPYLGAFVLGTTVFQIVLPWMPCRSFAFGGWLLGLLWALLINYLLAFPMWKAGAHLLILPMMVGFLALNFTGATTFTSLSGVMKEVRIAMPLMIAGVIVGIILRIVPVFIA